MQKILESTRNKQVYLTLSNQYRVKVSKKDLKAVLVAMKQNNENMDAEIEQYENLVIIKLK